MTVFKNVQCHEQFMNPRTFNRLCKYIMSSSVNINIQLVSLLVLDKLSAMTRALPGQLATEQTQQLAQRARYYTY